MCIGFRGSGFRVVNRVSGLGLRVFLTSAQKKSRNPKPQGWAVPSSPLFRRPIRWGYPTQEFMAGCMLVPGFHA